MPRSFPRALLAALFGAVIGAACLASLVAWRPGILLEMDRDAPRPVASGFYPAELGPDVTFAWTRGTATLTLPGLPRGSDWVCQARVRGGRPAGLPQPAVELRVDGVPLASRVATNDYETLSVTAPARPSRAGLQLSVVADATFVPSPSDPRQLGVQVDSIGCAPRGGALVWPPRPALFAAAAVGALFGATFSLLGIAWWGTAAGTLLIALAQAWALSTGVAAFTAYPRRLSWIAIWIAAATLAARGAAAWRRPLGPGARLVLAYSAGALFVELLGLLHPSKLVVDAVFQAHRLEWVLAGRYLFTQPMPDGVQFPYAIALYVVAAPWTAFTTDYVTLLRVVVCVARAAAAAMLYPMVTRTWGDARAGVLAVVLLHLVPLPYGVIGNANLTFAFGQSVAMAALAAAAAFRLGARDVGTAALLFVLTSVAFLSHVGIFPVLLFVLLALAVFYRWLGRPPFRDAARTIAIATVAAAVLSVVVYYGRFGEAYQTLERVAGRAVAAVTWSSAVPATGAQDPSGAVRPGGVAPPLARRAVGGVARGARAAGWPIVLLAVAGAWSAWRAGLRDRMGLALSATALAYLTFLAFASVAPVEERFLRYNDEFIDRLSYASMPLAVLLGARGAAWAWSAGTLTKGVSIALVLAAAALAAEEWLAWLR